jgi:TolB-like protein
VERKLVTILAADVAGYSRLMGADEEGTLDRLKAHRRELIDPKIAEHHGRIVKTTGDGMLVAFASPVEAVRCAVAVQLGMGERNADIADERRIVFRIGINLGDVMIDADDIYGDGVNVAARLEGIAEPGNVLLSDAVHAQVRDRVPLAFEPLGDRALKNIARPVGVYRVATRSSSAALALPDKPSIAILPFQNMSGDPEQEYFADGIVEDITTAIARLPWLFVIARNSSFTYKGKAFDIKQIGRDLGIRYALEGSVRKAGNRVRITGQLIDTTNGAHIWADRFDGALDDIFELQDRVASSVVGAIEPRLRQSEIERAARKPTEHLDAYDLFLRASAQVHLLTREGVEEAIQLSQRALAIDPAYAPAAALAGWCRSAQKRQGWIVPRGSEYDEGVRFARQAIGSGFDDPDTLWMAGYTVAYLAADHATGLNAIGRALVLNANSAHAWGAKGLVESYLGHGDPSIEAFTRAIRLSPLDPLRYHYKFGMALAHMSAGRYDDAVAWMDQALHEKPTFHAAIRIRTVLCGLRGEDGRDWLRRLRAVQPDLTVTRFAAHAATFFSPAMTELMLKGLRQAGCPRNSSPVRDAECRSGSHSRHTRRP